MIRDCASENLWFASAKAQVAPRPLDDILKYTCVTDEALLLFICLQSYVFDPLDFSFASSWPVQDCLLVVKL